MRMQKEGQIKAQRRTDRAPRAEGSTAYAPPTVRIRQTRQELLGASPPMGSVPIVY